MAGTNKEMIMATGRRKCAVAVVKLVKGKGRIFVNGKTLQAYIGNMPAVEMMVYRPLVLTENQEKYDVRVKAVGGGIVAQAAAIRHGISRALFPTSTHRWRQKRLSLTQRSDTLRLSPRLNSPATLAPFPPPTPNSVAGPTAATAFR